MPNATEEKKVEQALEVLAVKAQAEVANNLSNAALWENLSANAAQRREVIEGAEKPFNPLINSNR